MSAAGTLAAETMGEVEIIAFPLSLGKLLKVPGVPEVFTALDGPGAGGGVVLLVVALVGMLAAGGMDEVPSTFFVLPRRDLPSVEGLGGMERAEFPGFGRCMLAAGRWMKVGEL